MKRSTFRLVGVLLCSTMAALSLYFGSRLNWAAIPLGLAAIITILPTGRASILAVAITFALMLIGYKSSLPYYLDFAASRIFRLDNVNLADSHSLKGHYLLNGGFLGASRRIAIVEGEPAALDDFQRRSAFYLPELSRGACRNDVVRITRWATVIDSRCQDSAAPDK